MNIAVNETILSPFSLDLDAWINEPPSESSDEDIARTNIFMPTYPGSHR